MKENLNSSSVLEATGPALQQEAFPDEDRQAPVSGRTSVLAWLSRTIPTAVVLAALLGLACWGHHTGWTVPSFAALTGRQAREKDDWCSAHAVPESQCIECNTYLLPRGKDYGWCRKHGVPNCPFEHPDVAQLEHPPKITQADLDRAQRALDFLPRPQNNGKCKLHQRRIQFASEEAVEKAGIDVPRPVCEAAIVEAVSANGEITYDQTRVARLSARAPGTVCWVPRQVGDPIRRGDVLALVDASEVGKVKAEFLSAVIQLRLRMKTHERLQLASRAVAGQSILEAEKAISEAQIRLLGAQQALANLGLAADADDMQGLPEKEIAGRLRFLGLSDTVRQSLDGKTTTANFLPVTSPLDGVVVAREVVAGEVVDTAKMLFMIADTRQMWLTLNLRQEDSKKLALGQVVRFRTDGTGDEVQGTVAWISTSLDEKTRTLKVRANLANPEGRLRAGMFGLGQVVLREEKNAIVVPNEAVHWEGDCFVVFVRDRNYLKKDAPKVFHVRPIRIGARDAQNTEIIAGVLADELVVVKGSGVLRAELLKNNLGEG